MNAIDSLSSIYNEASSENNLHVYKQILRLAETFGSMRNAVAALRRNEQTSEADVLIYIQTGHLRVVNGTWIIPTARCELQQSTYIPSIC
jgi:hypothetical protein